MTTKTRLILRLFTQCVGTATGFCRLLPPFASATSSPLRAKKQQWQQRESVQSTISACWRRFGALNGCHVLETDLSREFMKEKIFLERHPSTYGFADQRKWTSTRGNTGLNGFNHLPRKSHVIRGSFTSLSFSISDMT